MTAIVVHHAAIADRACSTNPPPAPAVWLPRFDQRCFDKAKNGVNLHRRIDQLVEIEDPRIGHFDLAGVGKQDQRKKHAAQSNEGNVGGHIAEPRPEAQALTASTGLTNMVHIDSLWSTRHHQMKNGMARGPSLMARDPFRSMLPDQRRKFCTIRSIPDPSMTSIVYPRASGT